MFTRKKKKPPPPGSPSVRQTTVSRGKDDGDDSLGNRTLSAPSRKSMSATNLLAFGGGNSSRDRESYTQTLTELKGRFGDLAESKPPPPPLSKNSAEQAWKTATSKAPPTHSSNTRHGRHRMVQPFSRLFFVLNGFEAAKMVWY